VSKRSELLNLIEEKLAEAQSNEGKQPLAKPSPKRHTRAEANKQNAKASTGPRTDEGKQTVSANSLKHGFYANVEHLHPNDSPLYQQLHADLRMGLEPDGPAEEHLIQELAMLSARLKRLEAMEYALAMANIEGPPAMIDESPNDDDVPPTPQIDARDLTASYLTSLDQIERLSKIETHLRRAYNRTWDRLMRIQKARKQMPLDEALKQTQRWATYEALRTNQPNRVPARDPRIDEKGKLIVYPKDHPLWRPKKGEEYDERDHKIE
jgi:hypothetical protein